MDLNDSGNVGGAADFLGAAAGDQGAQQGAPQGGDQGAQQGAPQGGGQGAPQGGGQGAPQGGDQGGADPDWYGQLSGDVAEGETASNLDWVKAIGAKDVNALAKIARDNQKAARAGGIKVPGEDASADDIAAYRTAIGVPEKPADYAIPAPKDAEGNDIEINTALTERVAASAHKHGVPKAALDALLADEIQAQIAEHDEIVADRQAKAAEHVKGWGEAKDQNLANVNAAAKDAGLTREDMAYLRGLPSGPGKVLDMLAKMGSNFSEDTIINGDKRTFGMNAEQAQAEIAAIKADKALLDKAMVPGSAENVRYTRALEAVAAFADKAANAT